MLIEVTEKHIQDGIPHSFDRCPIGLAMNRNVVMGVTGMLFKGDWVLLPEIAREFIKAFDAGKIVNPISFEIF